MVDAAAEAAEDQDVGWSRGKRTDFLERFAEIGAVLVWVVGDGDGMRSVVGAGGLREGVEVAVDESGELGQVGK